MDENQDLQDIFILVFRCIGIVLLFVGTCGNILSFIILRRKVLRIYATTFLLSMLAVCDLVCLYFGLLRKIVEYMVSYDVFRVNQLPILCPIEVFILYLALQYSSWILALVAAERFFSVWFPMRARSVCTVRNAKIGAVVLLIILSAVDFHLLFTTAVFPTTDRDPETLQKENGHSNSQTRTITNNATLTFSSETRVSFQKVEFIRSNSSMAQSDTESFSSTTNNSTYLICDAKPEFDYFVNGAWPIIDMTIGCFVPFAVMLIFNFLIAWRIVAYHENDLVSAGGHGRNLSGMTVIMFACCFAFFALTLPLQVYMVVRDNIQKDPANADMMFAIWTVTNIMHYTNNAIHFFLYCLSDALFRRELLKLLQFWSFATKSVFCCWICYPERMPHDYSDFAEAEWRNKPIEGKAVKLVKKGPVSGRQVKSTTKSCLSCYGGSINESGDGEEEEEEEEEVVVEKPVNNDLDGTRRPAEQKPFIVTKPYTKMEDGRKQEYAKLHFAEPSANNNNLSTLSGLKQPAKDSSSTRNLDYAELAPKDSHSSNMKSISKAKKKKPAAKWSPAATNVFLLDSEATTGSCFAMAMAVTEEQVENRDKTDQLEKPHSSSTVLKERARNIYRRKLFEDFGPMC